LSIKNGEKILIVGPNGSGKTTLMHIICGFLDAEGEVKLPKLERISALLPSAGFIPGSLKDNINYENLTPQKRALFNKLTKELNLYNKIENDPLLLSEGEKKKFHIIMTLMKEADFYIFDEPLANVDVDSKDKIMNIIFELTKNKTLLIVLHDNEKFKNNFEKESTILNYD
jgi:ATP-binding cassette subfamily B protein